MAGTRRKFTPEFRAEAVRLVIETHRPVAHVAAEIGVGAQLLTRWVARAKPVPGGGGRALDADERAELERLRSENADLRLDRSFLKKAAVNSIDRGNTCLLQRQSWRVERRHCRAPRRWPGLHTVADQVARDSARPNILDRTAITRWSARTPSRRT